MRIGRVFHYEAAAVAIKRMSYFKALFLMRVSSISFTDLSCLLGRYRFSKFCMYLGVSPCKDVMKNIDIETSQLILLLGTCQIRLLMLLKVFAPGSTLSL